ncbi:unnamed protein product [Triticum turgidum subsp. durum]|uniref:Uncharacterized protein n=1 Tax=Triticum turgidum subsp. durum TaxID=4567 RepID=A0A9R1B0F5_TRITD|nr:unnamed protein product [Triticum turgidum subsp. durum]
MGHRRRPRPRSLVFGLHGTRRLSTRSHRSSILRGCTKPRELDDLDRNGDLENEVVNLGSWIGTGDNCCFRSLYYIWPSCAIIIQRKRELDEDVPDHTLVAAATINIIGHNYYSIRITSTRSCSLINCSFAPAIQQPQWHPPLAPTTPPRPTSTWKRKCPR